MKKHWLTIGVFLIVAAIIVFIDVNQPTYLKNSGFIYGTIYNFTYKHPDSKDLQPELEEVMHEFGNSLSTFIKSSTISKINDNTDLSTDATFEKLYNRAFEISELTDGAFDLTVAPLVNAWGFGYEEFHDSLVSQRTIDSILQFTGYKLIKIENGKLTKSDPRIKIDASAIAKGMSVDLVADYLESHGVKDYMVEIGGEIRVHGKNPHGKKWVIGIDEPIDDPEVLNREIISRINLTNEALATSGNYRNYYIKDGIKYSHTIDPKTGRPVRHNLLSATVVADDCMTADAWATACMVMGVEKSMTLAKMNKNIEVFLIYSGTSGEPETVYSDGFAAYLVNK